MSGREGILRTTFLALGVALLAGAAAMDEPFDHWQHRKLFLDCATCHAGASGQGALMPAPVTCEKCHDGKVEKTVAWTPRTGPAPSNLRFAHDVHIKAFAEEKGVKADSAAACVNCHNQKGEEYFRVKRAIVGRCLDCHDVKDAHFDAPPEACAQCHVPLTEAKGVPAARVAKWEKPKNHDDPDFQSLHGELAGPVTIDGKERAVSPACATCHARNFCEECHINGDEIRSIAALGNDPRSVTLADGGFRELKAPRSHVQAHFVRTHGHDLASASVKSCATCHTAESCQACHLVPPKEVRLLPAATPTRRGAVVERERPVDHGRDFTDGHGPVASSSPQSCAGCHTLEQCVDCHRPNAASEGSYHPVDFLSRHPVASYNRETSCQDCHNTGQFCQSCHIQSGLRSTGLLGTKGNYHDASVTFIAGHGQAARQSLESCVSCHSERDCLTCHSAVGGRRFNPHGPGWDADRMRRSNPQMCLACHGAAIPGT